MSSIATLNGVQYIVPAYNDTGWAQGAGNLSLYLAAIAAGTLQPTGGSFTLTADVDFGANFGLKALFLKSETANPASAGVIRLASADTIKWRNNANGADVSLSKDSSDNLLWAANKVYTAGGAAGIVNADIASGAAIAYSKLALTGAILNADLAGSIAYSKLSLTGAILNADLAGSIAYSKLTLTGSIVNGDLTAGTLTNAAINASAAIALSKLAALGTAKAVQTNAATGFLEASAVTNTELGYLSGVTSAIQTQFAATIANPLTANLAAGTHKLTGLAAGTTAGDSLRYEQLFGGTVTLTDNLIFSPTTKGILGTTTNDSAATGNVGQYVSSVIGSGSAVSLSTGTAKTITSISLTAGDWDISCIGAFGGASSPVPTVLQVSISTTDNTLGTPGDSLTAVSTSGLGTQDLSGSVPAVRASISGTTIYYLVHRATWTTGTISGYGRISARRVR